jgi:hypothetical protein
MCVYMSERTSLVGWRLEGEKIGHVDDVMMEASERAQCIWAALTASTPRGSYIWFTLSTSP